MDTGDDRFVLYLRHGDNGEHVEAAERPLADFASYEEARQERQRHHSAGRDCVIRYVGTAGGGD